MNLFHLTPRSCLRSVLRGGLLLKKARGPLLAIWLATESRLRQMSEHIAKHQGLDSAELLVAVRVSVPRAWLRRRRKAIWLCDRDIGPEQIQRHEWAPLLYYASDDRRKAKKRRRR